MSFLTSEAWIGLARATDGVERHPEVHLWLTSLRPQALRTFVSGMIELFGTKQHQ